MYVCVRNRSSDVDAISLSIARQAQIFAQATLLKLQQR